MSQMEREVVRRMRCGEYLPDTMLEDGRLLAETEAAGLFAATAARFRKLERSLRRTTLRLLIWLVLGIAGLAGIFAVSAECEGVGWTIAAVLLLLTGWLGVLVELLVFLTRLWQLMPCTGFQVTPGWRILLWFVPFFNFYWGFRLFPPLYDFPDPRESSSEARRWQLKILYFLACLPVLNMIAGFSREGWFVVLSTLIAVAVEIAFYLIFRAKACRRAGQLAEVYEEAIAPGLDEVAPAWRGAWRHCRLGGLKLAGWGLLIAVALWQLDAASLRRKMPSAEFREQTVASFAAGTADDVQVREFCNLAEALKALDCDNDSTPALREWLRDGEPAAAAMGRFLAEHPDFRLPHDWSRGYLMNEDAIDAVGNYGDWLAAAIRLALAEKKYAALPELFRRMADAAEFLRREGTMPALRRGMWMLGERGELMLELAETPEAWPAWSDEALAELAAAENRREADWRRAEPAAVDFAVVAAMDLRQLPDAACLDQTEAMFEMSPTYFYWYSLSWLGVREWRRYFNAVRKYRPLLENDPEKVEAERSVWLRRYYDESDFFAEELIDLLNSFLDDRAEFHEIQRQIQTGIDRERYRRTHPPGPQADPAQRADAGTGAPHAG